MKPRNQKTDIVSLTMSREDADKLEGMLFALSGHYKNEKTIREALNAVANLQKPGCYTAPMVLS